MSQDRVMLLIDADNVSVDIMEQALRLLMNQHGGVHVRRAYCTAESALKHQNFFKRMGIKPMVNLAAGKNSTDIALAVDAVDLVLAERPEVVVIASSDSDFAPLVQRLREKGCVVRGIGQKGKTGQETQDVYDDFTVLEHHKPASRAGASVAAADTAPRGRAAAGGRKPPARKAIDRAPEPVADRSPDAMEGRASERATGRRGGRGSDRSGRGRVDFNAETAEAPADLSTPTPAVHAEPAAVSPPAAEPVPEVMADPMPESAPAPEPESQPGAEPVPAAKKTTAARKTAAAKKTPAAKKAPAAKKVATKTAATKTPARKRASASAAEVEASTDVAAAAEAVDLTPTPMAASAVVAASPAPAPAPAAAPVPAPHQALADPKPRGGAVTFDDVLRCLPELKVGQSLALNVAAQRLRVAQLLGKSGSSLKLFANFGDRFELGPPDKPSQVRLKR